MQVLAVVCSIQPPWKHYVTLFIFDFYAPFLIAFFENVDIRHIQRC